MENFNELARDDPAFALLNKYISAEVIRNVNSAVKTQVTEVWRTLKQKVNPLKRKVEELEENINTMNVQLKEHEESIAEFKQSIASLSYKIEKLEDDRDTELQEQEYEVSIDDSEDDHREEKKKACPFLDDSKYSDVETSLFGSNDKSKKSQNDSRRQTQQTKNSQGAKGNQGKASVGGKSNRGRPLGSKNKTAPKDHLERENKRLKAKLEKLKSKETN